MDRFSPVAPAHIRVLVLPVGHIERLRFLDLLGRLQQDAAIIKLADVQPYAGDNDFLLSPKAFPQGSVFYNYATSTPSEQQQQLSPFELFREPLLVLGVVDRLNDQDHGKEKEMLAAAEYLRERHPRIVHRQLLALDEVEGAENEHALKSAICEVTACFLVELTTYTQAMQASPSIQTPGQTARSLQRTSSLRENDRLPGSGHTTPRQSVETLSSTEDGGSKPLPASRTSTPPTSFDQIASVNTTPTRSENLATNKVKHTGRASSQDRVSVQGFGSNTSSSKLKLRGKARVGIAIGSIYMMAGQWTEALRVLAEHTNEARTLSDHLWHAKGLENIVVCLLLHAWAGLEFQIPSICYPIAERTSGHVQRFSVNLPSDFRSADAAQQASVRRLATSIPELMKLILSLYRSREGSLELPFVTVSEATIRFCKLLAILHGTGGDLNKSALGLIAGTSMISQSTSPAAASSSATTSFSKGSIADILSHAQQGSEGNVPVVDQVALLAGIASVYALLRMQRKRAMTLKDLVAKLTSALTQARKRGAAEMGIHPAASLSADTGAEAILSVAEAGGGLNQMFSEVAATYGLQLVESPTSSRSTNGPSFFGSNDLQRDILQALAAFCEASPDLSGVLRLHSSMLRSFGPNSAVDTESRTVTAVLPKDDQVTASATISRTIAVAKQLGLPTAETEYWDHFLVRGVDFIPPSASRAIVDRSNVQSVVASHAQATDGNIYVSRPGTAVLSTEASQTSILVHGEVAECAVTLQNPYDISVDVESLELVTDHVKLRTSHRAIVLDPMRLQQVSLSVSPCSVGDFKITGCRIKIVGCAEQTFEIVSKPWAAIAPTLIKDLGQEIRGSAAETRQSPIVNGPEFATPSASVIKAQPTLALESASLSDSSLMLLDGEKQNFSVSLRNTSSVEASVFDVVLSNNVVQLQSSSNAAASATAALEGSSTLTGPVQIKPGSSATFTFQPVGRPGASHVQIVFYYSCQSDGSSDEVHARVLSVPIDITVNAALQVQHLDVLPLDEASDDGDSDALILSFDIGNAWPRSLSYHCGLTASGATSEKHSNLPNQEGVLAPGEVQRVCLPMTCSAVGIGFDDDAETARESLLRRLVVTWSGEGRVGHVNLSGLNLSPEAVDLIREAPIHISLELIGLNGSAAGVSNLVVQAGSFVTLRARLLNRAVPSTPLVVELHSRMLNFGDLVQDERRFAVVGAQHRFLPPIPPGGEAVVDFAACPLLSGTIELVATARPTLFSNDGKVSEWRARRSLFLRVEEDLEYLNYARDTSG